MKRKKSTKANRVKKAPVLAATRKTVKSKGKTTKTVHLGFKVDKKTRTIQQVVLKGKPGKSTLSSLGAARKQLTKAIKANFTKELAKIAKLKPIKAVVKTKKARTPVTNETNPAVVNG